ncbi:MAG: 4Fe-4S binding protein [Spirochaetota bacterium]
MKLVGRKRKLIQLLVAIITNSYIVGFIQGRVYRGGLKHICVPGLNCYSCPGALGSCPVGAFQTTLANIGNSVSLYVTGFVAMLAALSGRFTCGWLCPFGLIQELLYKIPFVKVHRKVQVVGTPSRHTPLRYLKYLILLLFVILLPAFVRDSAGLGETWFCAYICPAGTLEAALPLLLTNEGLREIIGWRFWLTFVIAVGIVIHSMAENRPFCKYLCPLGAAYAFGNRISIFRLEVDHDSCIECRRCADVCGMDLEPVSDVSNSLECIRCGACEEICPVYAIKWTHAFVPSPEPKPKSSPEV